MLAADTMEKLGIKRGDYVVKVNNRKVLDGVMDAAGIDPAARLTVLRAIDKADKFPLEEVRKLLGEGRKDESGDFTKGAGLDAKAADTILAFMAAGQASRLATCDALGDAVRGSARGEEGVAELREIADLLSAMNLSDVTVAFDPAIVRGLGYYTGPVLEAQVTFEITDEDGGARQFGSVAGGGRYDGLVGRFLDRELPATGVSIGVDRLLAALEAGGRINASATQGPVLVVVFDRAQMAEYVRIAEELRAASIPAEIFLGTGGMKPQLKYADRKGSPVAIIAGGDEFAAGTVSIKNLVLGAQVAAAATTNEDFKAEAKAKAQVTVARSDMAATVRAMLADLAK